MAAYHPVPCRKTNGACEIDLDDEEHGFGLGERLRAHDLDDEARKRLGDRIVVTRDGPRVFLYAGERGRRHARRSWSHGSSSPPTT